MASQKPKKAKKGHVCPASQEVRQNASLLETFNIIKQLRYDDETEIYTYVLDPRWIELFSNREYALLDWDARLQIARGQDMAKTLQWLIATSADPVQRFALDRLKALMVYKSPMRKFRQALLSAVAELERLDIIINGQIEVSTKGKLQLVIA